MNEIKLHPSVPTLAQLLAADSSEKQYFELADIAAVRRSESRRAPEKLLAVCQGVFRRLEEFGWALEVAGDDALIFGQPKSARVLRLGQNWTAYGKFVTLAQFIDNPHFPRFLRWETEGDVSLAVVERLSPLDVDKAPWFEINRAAELAHRLADGRPQPLERLLGSDPLLLAVSSLGMGAHREYYALDFGIENILQRPATGAIVFNDPWSEWGD